MFLSACTDYEQNTEMERTRLLYTSSTTVWPGTTTSAWPYADILRQTTTAGQEWSAPYSNNFAWHNTTVYPIYLHPAQPSPSPAVPDPEPFTEEDLNTLLDI